LQSRFAGTVLGAGLRDEAGAPLGKDYMVVTRKVGGRDVRVGIVGLLSRALLAESGGAAAVKAESVTSVLARLRPILRWDADVRVLLYHGPRAEAEQIARDHPEFDIIVFAHAGDHAAPE